MRALALAVLLSLLVACVGESYVLVCNTDIGGCGTDASARPDARDSIAEPRGDIAWDVPEDEAAPKDVASTMDAPRPECDRANLSEQECVRCNRLFCNGRCVERTSANCTRCGQGCSGGEACCDATCVSLNSIGNCGGCGIRCSGAASATPTCSAGGCRFQCNDGYGDCDGMASNGCEVNFRNNAFHCGRCNHPCSFTNATAACAAGGCQLGACNAGYANCDGVPGNGCEAVLATDLNHCGACGNVCPLRSNATRTCASGACGFSCNVGLADCDRAASNGCEVNTTTDVNHCGGCNMRCAARANTVPSCTVGACVYTCVTGFADCDGNAANGCEANTTTDVANCGRCHNACPRAMGGGASCAAGTCAQTCPMSWTNCSGTCRATASDVNNCGSCGRTCSFTNASATCVSGVCYPGTCAANFGNCDGDPANGCERSLAADVSNCGACNHACPRPVNGTATCLNGVCGVNCPMARINCAGSCVDSRTDVNNCGGCGFVCSPGQVCQRGVCQFCSSEESVCPAAIYYCANLQTDRNNCGSCGNQCLWCNRGVCNGL